MNKNLTTMSIRELRDLSAKDFNKMPEEERLATMQLHFGPKMTTRMAMLFFKNKSIILASEKKRITYAAALEQAPEIAESIRQRGSDYVCHLQPLISRYDN